MNRYSHVTETHADTGLELVRLTCEADASRTEIAFAPAMGCNIMSFVVDGREYLVASGDGRVLGTPILYPMPNRVRNAHFEFDGHSFDFEPNNTGNFIHGLVRERPWAVDEPVITNEGIACTMRFVFAPGCEAYDLFPISNTLTLKLTLSPHKLRFDWTIENQDESRRLPFGLAIHPYFAIQGERARVRLQVPAQKAMEAVDLLPTGKLIDIEDTPLGEEPVRLSELDLDDVFLGMAEDQAAGDLLRCPGQENHPYRLGLFHAHGRIHAARQALFLHREPILLDRCSQLLCSWPAGCGPSDHPRPWPAAT